MNRVEVVKQHISVAPRCCVTTLAHEPTAGIRAVRGGSNEIKRRISMWTKFVFSTVPERVDRWSGTLEAGPEVGHVPSDLTVEADVVVVGYGAAGACAALEGTSRLHRGVVNV